MTTKAPISAPDRKRLRDLAKKVAPLPVMEARKAWKDSGRGLEPKRRLPTGAPGARGFDPVLLTPADLRGRQKLLASRISA